MRMMFHRLRTSCWEHPYRQPRRSPCLTSKKHKSGPTGRRQRKARCLACRERHRSDCQEQIATRAWAILCRSRSRCCYWMEKGFLWRRRLDRHLLQPWSQAGSPESHRCKGWRGRTSRYNPRDLPAAHQRTSRSKEFPECKRSRNRTSQCCSNSNKWRWHRNRYR